jgi:hypothetical protein
MFNDCQNTFGEMRKSRHCHHTSWKRATGSVPVQHLNIQCSQMNHVVSYTKSVRCCVAEERLVHCYCVWRCFQAGSDTRQLANRALRLMVKLSSHPATDSENPAGGLILCNLIVISCVLVLQECHIWRIWRSPSWCKYYNTWIVSDPWDPVDS